MRPGELVEVPWRTATGGRVPEWRPAAVVVAMPRLLIVEYIDNHQRHCIPRESARPAAIPRQDLGG